MWSAIQVISGCIVIEGTWCYFLKELFSHHAVNHRSRTNSARVLTFCILLCQCFLRILFSRAVFRFVAKLSRIYREFPCTSSPLPPYSFSHYQVPHLGSTFVSELRTCLDTLSPKVHSLHEGTLFLVLHILCIWTNVWTRASKCLNVWLE